MSPYAFGTRSSETRALQKLLAARGLYQGPIDAIFGAKTRDAVAAARQQFGLGAGGVDSALLAAIAPRAAPSAFSEILARLAGTLLLSQLKGFLPMTFLSGYKTYIIAGAMLVAGVAGMLGIDIPSSPARRRAIW